MIYRFLKVVEKKYGKSVLDQALDVTTQDIKFNRIGFGKLTKPVDFIKIFNRSLKVCLKC